jgi:hypothetical protein
MTLSVSFRSQTSEFVRARDRATVCTPPERRGDDRCIDPLAALHRVPSKGNKGMYSARAVVIA